MAPDQYGHADAWMSPPAPAEIDNLDTWAAGERFRWAARLLVEGESRREDRIAAGADILRQAAKRHAGIRAALEVRRDGPGPGPRSIRLTPEHRCLLRSALVALGNTARVQAYADGRGARRLLGRGPTTSTGA